MNRLVKTFLEELNNSLEQNRGGASPTGGALPYVVAARLVSAGRRLNVLLPTEEERKKVADFLENLMGEGADAASLPVPDHDPYEGLPTHPAILLQRARALTLAALNGRTSLLVSAESFLYRVPLIGWWRRLAETLETNSELDRKAFRLHLWRSGYRDTDLVSQTGEVSFRGGILDLFPPGEPLPVRVEFFGDEVESLRYFDPVNQCSLKDVPHPVLCHPLSEAVMDDELMERLKRKLSAAGEFGALRLETLEENGSYPSLDTEIRHDEAFFGSLSAFADGRNWLVLDPESVERKSSEFFELWTAGFRRRKRPPFLAPERLFVTPGSVAELIENTAIDPVTPAGGSAWERFPIHPGAPYEAFEVLKKRIEEGYRCLALMRGRGSIERLAGIAAQEGLQLMEELPVEGSFPPGLYAAVAPVAEGIVYRDHALLAVTEQELFQRGTVERRAGSIRREAFSSGLRDLKPGDYLVHVEHGVGVFEGLKTLARNGVMEDYLSIGYAAGDRLLLPVARVDLVHKYVGPEGASPGLDRLGSAAWKKKTARVRKAVKKIAIDLLRLYATRKRSKAAPFPPDTPWQSEFESVFPYALTPDQERAVQEIKQDLESDRPMDRLVCGDVGFGKTEVAMRAAFKVAQSGRQVAVLCPTTVLALQHAERFRKRFAAFSVQVEMLSRFLSPARQREMARKTSEGLVQVLIGTHRLLSRDIVFQDLGLLIVDEEQRFGVSHKEKIKALKSGIDVLTLTATPIPRTLQMGLSGILSMSLIQTPPKDRLSIQTMVTPYNEELIISAVEREVARHGQVFYVHNSVETIAAAARRISELVPEARVGVAHGQMKEGNLEDTITRFFHGEFNTLVTTTIIENGIDLPHVNTLLVENAQNFGLTQLYQLRGRIGRSDIPAYAYLMIPQGGALKGDAEKRLATLKEFSELGAGFRVAAADLEIRGAGNFLGAEQSGHMAGVGFDLYMRMLEEAVSEERGEGAKIRTRCELNLGLDMSVPVEYISETPQRLSFYRELALAEDEEEVKAIKARTEDRFGRAPAAVVTVLEAVKLRLRAERASVKAISKREKKLAFAFDKEAPIDTGNLVSFLSARRGSKLDSGGSLSVEISSGENVLELAEAVLEAAVPAMAGQRRA